MASIRLATAANVRGFQNLSHALLAGNDKWTDLIDYDGLQDEIGRFRVWSGNLGALQKGHSSLDYRLRDSPLLSTNALKFLKELEDNINEACAVVSGDRLPYELQPKPEKAEDEDDNDDGFFDEDDDEDDNGESRTELSMRFAEIVDIIDNLYKLSVRIRTPTIRSRSLKAAAYKPKDPETGVDILDTYAAFDLQHTEELLLHLRQPHQEEIPSSDYDYLITRLSAAITLRRRQFKYWRRHRDKLGVSTISEEQTLHDQHELNRPDPPQRNDTLEAQPDVPMVLHNHDVPSQKTGKTLLSGTEATQHHQSLDELVDTKSVTSYAITVKDLHGKGVELPPPPRAADGEKDFECPYCYIICPARYGRGRAWRTHLLQDLQPYICTYPECDTAEQLFRSRREWVAHEASHRKAWRCPEHPAAIYKSSAGLEDHLRREHSDTLPETQLPAIVKVGETTTVEIRSRCPICCVSSDTEGLGDFHNHVANHLERIATFALPTGTGDDSDGVSSGDRSESSNSRDMSGLSLPSDASDDSELTSHVDAEIMGIKRGVPVRSAALQAESPQPASGAALSAESLHQLPDASQSRLDTLLAERQRDTDSASSVHSGSGTYNESKLEVEQPSSLNVSDIPTLRSLYRSRKLHQRDQSFAPNDSYNQLIAFCYDDLTRLNVDAIVNVSNKEMKDSKGWTLNHAIHKAAGPSLGRETSFLGKLKDQAVLTGAYNLPSKHVIHVARPGYSSSKGMGQFNQLIDCYRRAFEVAINYQLKSIAFPCIGTGGVGFPPRVAARIALQEVREYLDAHPNHRLERIVFCVNTAPNEKAYMDFFPVYFPPTHDDLQSARSSIWSGDRATIALQVLDTRNEIQKVSADLKLGLRLSVPFFQEDIINSFSIIDSALTSIRRYLMWSNEPNNDLQDLKLLCTVVQLFCGNITEIIELAKDHATLGQRSDKAIWDDYVSDMQGRHGIDPSRFLSLCSNFIQGLDNMITRGGGDFAELSDTRKKLKRYKLKARGGRDAASNQDQLNEVLYTREFQRETIAQARDTVKLHQIQSMAQLYKLGELEEKHTLAHPSAAFNHIVCLAREDITKLEVDIIVNSTDRTYGGIGTLDRTVFSKGGVELREVVKRFGMGTEGEVKLSEGYLLPSKRILHVVPPEQYRKDTKDILRKIYREVLHTAVTLQATSIALPSIGTGMLNYPRRDCASLALEEVKRFLESADPDSKIRKIIFVVYSSNDEFVYKSILPVYFPPIDTNVNRALPPSITRQATGGTISSKSSDAPRRTLFGSVGEALRSVRFGKQLESSRAITANEEHALIGFEAHAKDCDNCSDVKRLYREERALCKEGYSLAQTVLWHMNMQSDQKVYTKPDSKGQIVQLEVPADMFPISMSFLATVEKGHQNGDGPYGAIVHQQELRFCESLLTTLMGPKYSAISYPFVAPVDPVAMNIPTYFQIIKKPMDLGSIEKNLREKTYHSAEEFYSDVQLVFSNCYNFNPEGSVVNSVGKQLQKVFENLWKEKSAWLAGHTTTSEQPAEMRKDDEEANQGLDVTEEQPKKVRAHVVTRSSTADEWTIVTSDECQVRVYSNKVFILELDGMETNRRPLVWLELSASTVVERHMTTPEVLLVGATHLQSSRAQTEGQVLFRCRSDNECNSLLRMLRSTIEAIIESQTSTSGPRDESERADTDNYPKRKQRIRDIRDELASVKRATGGLTDLQYKMERLNTATSSLDTRPQQASAVTDLYDTLRSPLATRVLLCLIADMQSRPGSYVGLGTDSIVSALRSSRAEIMVALEELESEGQVHNTLDADTWVVTHMPKDLPMLSTDNFEEASRNAGLTAEPQTESIQSASDTTTPVPNPSTTTPPLSPEASKVHTYLLNYTFAPPDGAHHILDIAAAVYLSREEVRLALAQLRDLGLANVTGKDGWWWATKAEQKSQEAPPVVRDPPSFTDTPPSPTIGPTPNVDLDLDTLDIADFVTYPSTSHTRLDKRLIDASVLIAGDESYEDVGDGLVVHRVLRRGEIEAWAAESKKVRDAVGKYRKGEKWRWEETDWGVRDVLWLVGGRESGMEDREGSESGSGIATELSEKTERRRSTEKEKDDGTNALTTKMLDTTGLTGDIHPPLQASHIPTWPMQEGGLDGGAKERDQDEEGSIAESRVRRKWRRSGEKSKGKQKEERDEEQGRLDRVIAGDVREEEMRRFADRDDERYA